MFTSRKREGWSIALRPALIASVLLVGTLAASAGEPPPGGWPWLKRPKIHGYDETKIAATLPPVNVTRPPMKYTITITVLPQSEAQGETNAASITAHLPEDAQLWIGDYQTKQRGMLRHFQSPSLKPGSKYRYTARVVWSEDGQWVSQTKDLPVSAGAVSCLFLTKTSALADALAELPPEDKKLAEQQRVCPIQPANQLGAMGPPVKMMLNGQPVFLCCKDCEEAARKNPEQTLGKVKELAEKKDKNSVTGKVQPR